MRYIFGTILLAFAVVALGDGARGISGPELWVDGANGNDLNDCTHAQPCKQIQSAIDKITQVAASIHLADWSETYDGVDLSHHKAVTLTGNCDDPSQVKVASLIAHDMVIFDIKCLSTQSIHARQSAIVNLLNIHFLETTAYHVNAALNSNINYLGGIVIRGGADSGHLIATRNSFVLATSDITIPDPVSFGCFATATYNSSVLFGDNSVTGILGLGAPNTTGKLVCTGAYSIIDVPAELYAGGMN